MNLRVGSPFIRWFASLGTADRPSVGDKAASLGELDRAGLRVPPGFVVTNAAFERMLALLDTEGSIRARVARLDPNDTPGVKIACAEIRERIESAPVPNELHAVLVEAHRELNEREQDIPVAVRSSAACGANGANALAGLHDTYLWVRGLEGIVHCVRSCWASLYGTESVTTRLRLRIPEKNVAMGVVIQRMVNAHCSGTLFTRDTAIGDRSFVTVEGSWGLGSSLSDGEVTPDRFVVSKVTGDIVKRTVAEKLSQHLPDTIAGGVRREPVPDELRNVQCLTDSQIGELAQLARRVERHYGSAQDIEWAIAHGERGSHLLQSRPELVRASGGGNAVVKPPPQTLGPVVSLLSGRQRG